MSLAKPLVRAIICTRKSTTARTPILQQYFRAKNEYPGTLLAMRVGDFYEFYGEDAEIASREMEIALTSREDGKNNRVAMAGVPYHAVERYIAKLLQKNFKVALCDQVEDPRQAKGLVKRRVTRVITPGTLLEDSMLDAKQNNYLVAAVSGEPRHGLSVVDVSTGEFMATEIDGDQRQTKLLQEIMRLDPAEILVPEKDPDLADEIKLICDATITPYEDYSGPPITSKDYLQRHFETANLRGYGCEDYTSGLDAAALVLKYLRSNQVPTVQHITSLSTYSVDGFMHVDSIARRHLELTQNLSDGSRKNTLVTVLDHTETPMGARLLRRWIDEPLLDVASIELRLDSVDELAKEALRREEIREALHPISDLERLISRAATGTANPRDLVALRRSLHMLPLLRTHIENCSADRLKTLSTYIAPMDEMTELLDKALPDEPPMQIREGGIIRDGYSYELDTLRQQSGKGKKFIAELELHEREQTGINSLKVGFNAVFGYYIEIPKSQISKVPAEYDRKQTTANAERYTTVALKEYQVIVSGAEDRIQQLEYDLFVELRAKVAQHASRVLQIARAVAEIDVLTSFAEISVRNHYTRPVIITENAIAIKGGRHPVVEHFQPDISFVPNDCVLNDDDQRLIVLTGPNMSGKSTYLRQTAIIALMAHMGCFVPADEACTGLVDRIFTRVGARDELTTGQSTFMVEMSETANILNNATPRSLVVLDEIGRGTSTYDGMAIARAVAESLVEVGCKTLFATHYHQLNDLADQMSGVCNFRVAVKEQGDHVIWLHKVLPGGTDRSYGIQVARMAGVPRSVVERATEILLELEQRAPLEPLHIEKRKKLQLTLFEAEQSPILEELKKLNLSEMTPVEALMKLDEWRRKQQGQK